MTYKSIVKGHFLKRPNRFIAHVLIDGKEEIAHVKNTGRCKELLIEGVTVYLEPSDNPNRKTKFSLVAVEKNGILINMDSQAPNKVLELALESGRVEGFPYPLDQIRREYTYGDSRLDFLLKKGGQETLVEVKGVTLEENGVAMFPDAPTQRGIKHILELIGAVGEGYGAIICFIIQMSGVEYFCPNYRTHSEFGEALIKAEKKGVNILAYSCDVSPNSISLNSRTEVRLEEGRKIK